MNLPRTISRIVPEGDLPKKLAEGRQLRVKLGIDPTSPHIHIGNAIGLHNALWFQQQGHKVVVIIGNATAVLGDPSGRDKTRPMLDPKTVQENAHSWVDQLSKFFNAQANPNLIEFVWNGDHFDEWNFQQLLRFASGFTVQQMIERDSFRKRLDAQTPVGLHELLYPIMQGFDSVEVEADIELGGTDQLFNIGVGRKMQEIWYAQANVHKSLQVGVFHDLLPGIDGNAKMSKSLGNAIGIDDPPNEMFGKAMSVSDALTDQYMRLATDLPDEEIARERGPKDRKILMAQALVSRWHGPTAAAAAAEEFERVFSRGEAPTDAPLHEVTPGKWRIADLLAQIGLASSKSDGRRKIEEKAVNVGGHPVTPVKDAEIMVVAGGEQLIRLGRRYARVVGR